MNHNSHLSQTGIQRSSWSTHGIQLILVKQAQIINLPLLCLKSGTIRLCYAVFSPSYVASCNVAQHFCFGFISWYSKEHFTKCTNHTVLFFNQIRPFLLVTLTNKSHLFGLFKLIQLGASGKCFTPFSCCLTSSLSC